MVLYKAEKNGLGFFIQANMVSDYSALGYTIYKYEPVEVEDVKEEVAAIAASTATTSE